ncbi:hypothetical protein QBC45DRAFT_218826 [Copromyces sp. CBS 386.78]|nr:hypothetical protein QBC45DRAFT_218826 [Copromyces sp. CBS 386.78]
MDKERKPPREMVSRSQPLIHQHSITYLPHLFIPHNLPVPSCFFQPCHIHHPPSKCPTCLVIPTAIPAALSSTVLHRPCSTKPSKHDCTPAEANSTSSRSSGSNIISQAKLPKWNWSSTTPKNSTTFSCSTGSERISNGNSSQNQEPETKTKLAVAEGVSSERTTLSSEEPDVIEPFDTLEIQFQVDGVGVT